MSKLPKQFQFLDLSDYGRSLGRWMANALVDTIVTPIHVTIVFFVVGLGAVYCIVAEQYLLALILLLLKSAIDAADGELARIRQTPSYTGRYLDSICDILLNFILILTIGWVTDTPIYCSLLAFFCIQLQGTLYNYYYVILRNVQNGDRTSQIFETKVPTAFPIESQKTVNIIFRIYTFLYGVYDRMIYFIDGGAKRHKNFPNWFMTALSAYGLGFQLLLIGIFLIVGLIDVIIPFFICYTALILIFVMIRKYVLK